MKIGIDARMYGAKQTGIGIYIENLIKNILNLDDKNEYVLFLNEIEGVEKLLKKYKNVKLIKADIPWYSYGEQLIFPFLIWREKIDLMHFPHFNVPIFCPVKFVVTIHDMTPKYFPGNKVGRSFFRRIMFDVVMRLGLNKAEKIIAVSNFTKNEILKFYPQIKKEKVEVIYEGIREEFFDSFPSSADGRCAFEEHLQENLLGVLQYNCEALQNKFSEDERVEPLESEASVSEKARLSSAPPFIFYTGVWRNHKNLVGIIKAFKILKDKYKIPHKLVLGGSEDPNYPEVRKTWDELKLENDIILTGFLDFENQRNLYRHCDLYVLPSFSEGFSFTPLEAMSQGAAVALSDIPAHRELSGDLPVYFNPKYPEDMAEKIYSALTIKDFRERIKIEGPICAKKYQWQNCASDTLTKVYNYDNI